MKGEPSSCSTTRGDFWELYPRAVWPSYLNSIKLNALFYRMKWSLHFEPFDLWCEGMWWTLWAYFVDDLFSCIPWPKNTKNTEILIKNTHKIFQWRLFCHFLWQRRELSYLKRVEPPEFSGSVSVLSPIRLQSHSKRASRRLWDCTLRLSQLSAVRFGGRAPVSAALPFEPLTSRLRNADALKVKNKKKKK